APERMVVAFAVERGEPIPGRPDRHGVGEPEPGAARLHQRRDLVLDLDRRGLRRTFGLLASGAAAENPEPRGGGEDSAERKSVNRGAKRTPPYLAHSLARGHRWGSGIPTGSYSRGISCWSCCPASC